MKRLMLILAMTVLLVVGCALPTIRDAEKKRDDSAYYLFKGGTVVVVTKEEYDLAMEKRAVDAYNRGERVQHRLLSSTTLSIGMYEYELKALLGLPESVNTSVGSWGTHKQYVYPSGWYVYVENGKVTSWQTSR